MAESEREKTSSSSMTLDSSLLLDSLSPTSPSTMKDPIPDWSLLPEELLQLIPTHVEKNCCILDVIHARSVCRSWRSSCPLPARQSYSIPSVTQFTSTKKFCTLEKIPLFLFRVITPPMLPSEYFLGGIARNREDHHMVLQSPLQCSVKVNIPGSDPSVMNMLDCQILPLGHRYRIIGKDPEETNRAVAILPLNEEGRGGGGFVVFLNYGRFLLVLRSSENRWVRYKRLSSATCQDLFTFRGKFYAIFLNGDIFVINPYNLRKASPLTPPQDLNSSKYLVPSGDDEELFLVEKIVPAPGVFDFNRLACRVSKLDEESGEWIVVTDLGDRVVFIGQLGNVSCSGKELPDGCGLTRNSILFTDEPGRVNYAYKYGVETGNEEDDSFWRLSKESRVLIRNRSPPVVALRVETPKPNWSLLPGKLLQLISTHLEKNGCFADSIHARSVCSSWRPAFRFPDLNQSYTLPSCNEFTEGLFPSVSSGILKKFPLFLFRVQTQTPPESPPSPSEYFLGGIVREDDMELLSPLGSPQRRSEDDMELLSPPLSPPSPSECFLRGIGQEDDHTEELSSLLQCSVKANFPGYNPILTNMLDCQIIPLGHYYKILGLHPDNIKRSVAFLPLNDGEEEFAVIFNSLFGVLLVLRSFEMRWIRIERIWSSRCEDLYTFRGNFYAISGKGEIFVIDPYKNPIEATELMTPRDLNWSKYLVPSGNDEELFLVEKFVATCRVSKLDVEAGEWIVVSDLGDRVFFIGQLGNVAFSVKKFPDGCGLSENSILFTDGERYDSNVTFEYKYDLGFWRLSKENRVLIRNKSPPVLALRIDRLLDA